MSRDERWRAYCEECGNSVAGITSEDEAEHLARAHNAACPDEAATVEKQEPK